MRKYIVFDNYLYKFKCIQYKFKSLVIIAFTFLYSINYLQANFRIKKYSFRINST